MEESEIQSIAVDDVQLYLENEDNFKNQDNQYLDYKISVASSNKLRHLTAKYERPGRCFFYCLFCF